jgi:hypothetical protein
MKETYADLAHPDKGIAEKLAKKAILAGYSATYNGDFETTRLYRPNDPDSSRIGAKWQLSAIYPALEYATIEVKDHFANCLVMYSAMGWD